MFLATTYMSLDEAMMLRLLCRQMGSKAFAQYCACAHIHIEKCLYAVGQVYANLGGWK